MLLHSNEFPIWRNGDELIIAKFQILGMVLRADGKIISLPRPEFWDTSRNPDPTTRVMLAVKFQFHNIDPESLTACRVKVFTNDGRPVTLREDFRNDDGRVLDYRSYYPIRVEIENDLTNMRTMFLVRWDRMPHAKLKNEYVFWLRVERREESMKGVRLQDVVVTPGNDHGEQPEIPHKDGNPDPNDETGKQCTNGAGKPRNGRRVRPAQAQVS